jgi:hypothetical protein
VPVMLEEISFDQSLGDIHTHPVPQTLAPVVMDVIVMNVVPRALFQVDSAMAPAGNFTVGNRQPVELCLDTVGGGELII